MEFNGKAEQSLESQQSKAWETGGLEQGRMQRCDRYKTGRQKGQVKLCPLSLSFHIFGKEKSFLEVLRRENCLNQN